ncbi:MAG: CHAT domain-containing protein [Chloroflexales bacterium]|nr:CHAT domain-containing protein [Chloroflexales bacterium]
MSDIQERAHKERLLTIYRRNLVYLEQQAASAGGELQASVAVRNQLADTRAKIAELEQSLNLAPFPATAPREQAAPTPPAPPPPAQLVPITLDFRLESTGPWITWRSHLTGREDTPFTPPYDDGALPLVIRALDALQHPSYPTPLSDEDARHFTFHGQDQAILAAHGLWRQGRVAPEAPRLVGQAIYQALGPVGQALIKAARNTCIAQGLRISYILRFPPGGIALAALPWELLWEEDKHQSLLVRGATIDSCERYLDLDLALPPPLPAHQRLHLLALSPAYGIPEPVRRSERAARLQTWSLLRDQGKISFDEISPLTVASLNDYLLNAPGRPDIIHYYGHGTYRDGRGFLQLDGDGGGADQVSTERLAPLLGDTRLLVLHACQSATFSAQGGLLTGIAPALSLVSGAVVAMQMTVSVAAATRFSQVLYQQLLGHGRSLQDAVSRARQVLFTEASGGESWYVPTLYIRSREQRPIYLVQ